MRAVVKVAAAAGAVELRDLPVPEPGAGEVLVRVAAASICGSDLHFFNWDKVAQVFFEPPMTMGHEFSGTVEALGDGVRGVALGDRVAAESVVYCGTCAACRRGSTQLCANRRLFGIHRAGGMAELVCVPAQLLHAVPAALDVRQAAILEPAVVALHGVLLQPPRPGDRVLVLGPGPVGLLAAQAARTMGARVLVAGTPADAATRLAVARELRLETLDPSAPTADAARDVAGGLADLVVECSGSGAALASALAAVRPGGAITLIGLFGAPVEVDLSAAIRKELSIRASYIGTPEDFERALGLIATGALQVGPLLRPYPLDEALRGFQDALDRSVMKPLLLPG